jgi:hypothetical protein
MKRLLFLDNVILCVPSRNIRNFTQLSVSRKNLLFSIGATAKNLIPSKYSRNHFVVEKYKPACTVNKGKKNESSVKKQLQRRGKFNS